ncbi:MAG: phosphohydrolase, partial [Eggerthellaceae bacterium]|nr:phosphohydrolase [Eggerthellaceae bacterium]
NSVRVLDVLYRRNVSLQMLDGALCHNGEFEQQELQVGDVADFAALDALVEACEADEATIEHLRPSTLEGCVVRVADMIAYIGKDRDDALDMGVLPDLDCFETRVLGRDNSTIIHNLTTDIINNSFGRDRIAMSRDIFEDLRVAKRQNYELIYLKEGMVGDTKNVVEDMFEQLYARLLEDLRAGREDSPLFTDHVATLVRKSRSWTPEAYLAQDADLIVRDYISSMTDAHFVALFRTLFPNNRPNIIMRRYL